MFDRCAFASETAIRISASSESFRQLFLQRQISNGVLATPAGSTHLQVTHSMMLDDSTTAKDMPA